MQRLRHPGTVALLLCCSVGVVLGAESAPPSDQVISSIDSLDCKSFDIDLTAVGPDLLTPGKADMAAFFREVSKPEFLERYKRSQQLDPNGLCHYRDRNKSLPPPSRNRVVFIGDSITENWNRAAPNLFRDEIINRGVSGQVTGQMLARFRQDVIDLHPQVVHIMAGTNDISPPAGMILTRSNIASMVDLARQHGIRIILGSVTPSSSSLIFPKLKPAPHITALNDWLKTYARREQVMFVDYHSPLADREQGLRQDLGNDGLHPNRNGYALMTPLAEDAIRRQLSRK